MSQQVIINADDFGKSPGRNRAVHDSFSQGLICSAGLIVTGKHLPEAVELMKKGGYVDRVHLHVNLSANLLHEDSDDTPLTEEMRRDPFFSKNGKFKKYRGLPNRLTDIRKWRVAYHEIEAQYKKFIEVTEGKGDVSHIDFHLWYNLTWPVSLALRRFTRKYRIKSVRYIGEHQKEELKYRIYRIVSWNPRVTSFPSTNIDYFLSKRSSFESVGVIELYCHPNYKEGVFLDDSPSYLKHERQPMLRQIQELRKVEGIEAVSWNTIV